MDETQPPFQACPELFLESIEMVDEEVVEDGCKKDATEEEVEIEITTTDDEEVEVEVKESEEEDESEEETSFDMNEDDSFDLSGTDLEGSEEEGDEGVVYEIELDEPMEGDEEFSEEEFEEPIEGDVEEAARTKWNTHGDKAGADRAGLKGKKVYAAGAINEEVATLRKQNAEYKKALVMFKEKLKK